MSSVVWFRDDLRVLDNPALSAAIARGEPVVALYVLEEGASGLRPLGAAPKWWLHHSLASLREDLRALGIPLALRRGSAVSILPEVVERARADAVVWNRRYGGPERRVDGAIKRALREAGCEVTSFAASLLHEPWTVTTGAGAPYAVFTPFWRMCLKHPAPRLPLEAPSPVSATAAPVFSEHLRDWRLLPENPDWSRGIAERWQPGERTAQEQLKTFVSDDLGDYDRARDEPGLDSTSLLSPRLRWGEVSPFSVWHEASKSPDAAGFLSELGWREFAWHTLYHFPDLATRNLRSEFDEFAWPPVDEKALDAWKRGRTGFPLVDAGMNELWSTGHMHNRVRMVVASFLVKNLLVDWRVGEEWFWDTLVDADAASNPFNWQWVAGSGADAVPYFRIFNPVLQAKIFDPDGTYIQRWGNATSVPQIVDLARTRRDALDAYQSMRSARGLAAR